MTNPDTPPALTGARILERAFEAYHEAFQRLTRRARRRFEDRDWAAHQRDTVERLELYRRVVDRTLERIEAHLGEAASNRGMWTRIKEAYRTAVARRNDRELAETFLNSVTRRIFTTVGVDPALEFVGSDGDSEPPASSPRVFRAFDGSPTLEALITEILEAFAFRAPYADLARDAKAAAREIVRTSPDWAARAEGADVARGVFFRNKGAYLVGRLRGPAGASLPLILALLHEPEGIVLDAVIADEDGASIVFGFTHSYFHVEVEHPRQLVGFLRSLLPAKRVAELYIALGYNKHGKTELYRDLLHHLALSEDPFVIAPGDRGLVMVVFTLASYDLVFKVIRDRFAEPKTTTRERVMDRYGLVFRHDRAGRLVDAQEFEHLQFPRSRFDDRLLAELLATAGESVALRGDQVAIRHLYVERRLTPLNLVFHEAPPGTARAAALDFGQAIRDLARTGIFPGDVLPKNFGLTRHGRVVFYDYDELAPLSDCRFRDLPDPDPGDETAAEPWFYVADNDIFPEELQRFLGLPPALQPAFLEAHGEVFTGRFWRDLQEELGRGAILDIFPYPAERRLRNRG